MLKQACERLWRDESSTDFMQAITYCLSRDSITSGILLASGIFKGEPLDDSNISRAVFQKPGFIY